MEINDIINGLGNGGNCNCGNNAGINSIPGLCGGLGNGFGSSPIIWILLLFFFGFGRNGCSNGLFGNMNNNNGCCCNDSCCCCNNSKVKSAKSNDCCCNNQGMGGSWWLFLLVILFLCTNNGTNNNNGCSNSIVEV